MWSLPNIVSMNEQAVLNQKTLEEKVALINSGKLRAKCNCCYTSPRKATAAELYFDIFSDAPKGLVATCDSHSPEDDEGMFRCATCERLMVLNYTWELYRIDDDCLPCAAKKYVADQSNWIDLNEDEIAKVDFDRIRKARHVIGVEMPVPAGIKFFDNAEFDSGDGHQISGIDVSTILENAQAEGHERAIMILDAGYQFAVSVGVYVPATKAKAAA